MNTPRVKFVNGLALAAAVSKRVVNQLGKLISGKWAHAIFVLCGATSLALAAQTPVWAVTFVTLFSFDGTDGADPTAGLIQAANGNLYGTTYHGGPGADGTVFEINLSGTLTAFDILDFSSDGVNPYAGLVQATNGNLYGATTWGGANYNGGTIFKISPNGNLAPVYSFCAESGCTDGEAPYAGLVQATNGRLYGTTFAGGAYSGGTVFDFTPSGTLTTLYSFCSETDCADGANPEAGLVQASNGSFYGTTGGGVYDDGTVFKITPKGTLTTLYAFDGADGEGPEADLIQTTSGELCGTTTYGGANHYGTVFCIAPTGKLKTLYNFCSKANCAEGAETERAGGLVQDTNGNLYGTTYAGGAYGLGTVFEIIL